MSQVSQRARKAVGRVLVTSGMLKANDKMVDQMMEYFLSALSEVESRDAVIRVGKVMRQNISKDRIIDMATEVYVQYFNDEELEEIAKISEEVQAHPVMKKAQSLSTTLIQETFVVFAKWGEELAAKALEQDD